MPDFSTIKKLKSWLYSTSGIVAESKMAVETVIDDTLICRDGSMGTMVRLKGLRTMKALSDFEGFLDTMARRLMAPFSEQGHAVQFYFQRDPSYSRRRAKELVAPKRQAAEYFGLNLRRQFDMQEDMIAGRVIPEASYIVFWTRPAVLDPALLKRMEEETRSPPFWPKTETAQHIFSYAQKIESIHRAWVSNILTIFKDLQISIPVMSGKDALQAMALSVRPTSDRSQWDPWLPGTDIRPEMKPVLSRGDLPSVAPERNDASDDLWPNLVEQVMDGCDVEALNGSNVRIGNTVWSSFQMSLGPLDQQPFSRLIKQVGQNDEIPWRVSFLIETDVLKKQRLKEVLASITGLTSQGNSKPLYHALKAAREDAMTGHTYVGMQIIFSTWASTAELRQNARLLEDRENRLQRSIEAWGSTQVDTGGDPFETTMGAMLGINPTSPAVRTVCPLINALTFLPLDRDASAMESGSLTFFTDYDTAFPWEEGSSQQLSGFSLFAAPPGSGKSGTVSSMALAYLTSPVCAAKTRDRRLPFLGFIDVGFSQKGTVETIRDALPPHRRNEAQYHRLQNTEEYAINPLDTQPGLRKPLSIERSFLMNLFVDLVTPIGSDAPPPLLAEVAAAVIDQTFAQFSDVRADKGTPKKYYRGNDREADGYIDKYKIPYSEGVTTWWTLVDSLHAMGTPETTEAAILVQRNAVPLISDLGKILTSETIEQEWGNILVPGSGQRLLDLFKASLTSVGNEYKMLSQPTRFRLGQGRYVVLDVGHIASGTGAYADRLTSVVYQLARSVLTKGYYLTDDLLNGAPDVWRAYHIKRVQLYREAPKRLVYDEFHKTKNSRGVRDQVVIDAREGRKWGVTLQLLSQSNLDFDEEMYENATSMFVLGIASEGASLTRLAERYNLSEKAADKIKDGLNGPGKRGAPFLLLSKMKDGVHEHYLFNVKTAFELWADSTTPDDCAVRNNLAEKIGFVNACFSLAKRFKSGTSVDEINRLVARNSHASPTDAIVQWAEQDYYRERDKAA